MCKDFMSLCLGEIAKQGYTGTSLHTNSWSRIREALASKYPSVFDTVLDKQKFVKNRWDQLKKKYGVWRYLKNQTGNPFDEGTEMFNFTEDQWNYFIKRKKESLQFKTKRLEYRDEMYNMFEGVLATGESGGCPMMMDDDEVDADVLQVDADEESAFKEEQLFDEFGVTSTTPATPTTPITHVAPTQTTTAPTKTISKQCSLGTSKRKRVESSDKLGQVFENMCVVMTSHLEEQRLSKLATGSSSTEADEGEEFSIVRCLEFVEYGRDLLDIDEDTLGKAINTLSKKREARKQFLQLKTCVQRSIFLKAMSYDS